VSNPAADSAVGRWTVVIPVKGTSSAKSRLGGSPTLATAIALDSVEAALGAARIIVVTSASAAAEFSSLGAEVVVDAGQGLIAACRQGIAAAAAGPVAVMLGDVPALTSSELVTALELASGHPLAFVADAENDGTVLITALDPATHVPAFGTHSRVAHLAAGYSELDLPADCGLRCDVDTAAQLAAIPVGALGRRTAAALERIA
jgi:2-phospho-L-lactate guanylyltransferase